MNSFFVALTLTLVSSLALTNAASNIIFVPRSDVPAGSYSSFLGNLSSSFTVSSVSSVNDLASAIQSAQSTGNSIYLAAHGMTGGGQDLQTFVNDNLQKLNLATVIKGVILINSFLTRTQRPDARDCIKKATIAPVRNLTCLGGCLKDGTHACAVSESVPDFPISTLTIGSELDGVVRITRIAEAAYTQRSVSSQHPVVVITGASHLSVLNAGVVLPSTAPVDIQAEATPFAAVSAIVSAIKGYTQTTEDVDEVDEEVALTYKNMIKEADDYFQNIYQAFAVLEGNWFFTGFDDETGSSAWAADAQSKLVSPYPGPVTQWTGATNAFHLLSDETTIPPYFREQHRAQIVLDGKGGASSSTVAQNRYVQVSLADVAAGLNGFGIIKEEKGAVLTSIKDDGSGFVSAIEIATKLRSRQYLFNVTNTFPAPDSLDAGSHCRAINEDALTWALSALSPAQAARYNAGGRALAHLTLVDDTSPTIPAGPFWIWDYAAYGKGNNVTFASPFAFYSTSADPYGAGNHYCKLLSPARALEFIIIDSLRVNPSSTQVEVATY